MHPTCACGSPRSMLKRRHYATTGLRVWLAGLVKRMCASPGLRGTDFEVLLPLDEGLRDIGAPGPLSLRSFALLVEQHQEVAKLLRALPSAAPGFEGAAAHLWGGSRLEARPHDVLSGASARWWDMIQLVQPGVAPWQLSRLGVSVVDALKCSNKQTRRATKDLREELRRGAACGACGAVSASEIVVRRNAILSNLSPQAPRSIEEVVEAAQQRQQHSLHEMNQGWDGVQFKKLLRWYRAQMPTRNIHHELINLPFELPLVELIHGIIRELDCSEARGCSTTAGSPRTPARRLRAVLDVGGGNGILSWMVLKRREDLEAIVVDRVTPGVCIDVMEGVGCPHYRRVKKDVATLSWAEDIRHDPASCAVISKHLCGSGVDELLRQCAQQNVWPRAFVLSTCCHFRSMFHQYIHQAYLERVCGVTSRAAFAEVAAKTSWLQAEREPWMWRIGEGVEELLDGGRLLWLRERGYVAARVSVAHPAVSPRNKVLVALRNVDGTLLSQ